MTQPKLVSYNDIVYVWKVKLKTNLVNDVSCLKTVIPKIML